MSFRIPKKKKPVGRPPKNKGGRPTIFTPETIQKLEQAFSIGCTDTEATLFANISMAALYDFQNKYPEFVERKRKLKESLTLRSRLNVAQAINAQTNPDIDLSKWYLERKRKEEFSLRQETEHSGAVRHSIESLEEKELDNFIAENLPT
jgi:hypothetical protein